MDLRSSSANPHSVDEKEQNERPEGRDGGKEQAET